MKLLDLIVQNQKLKIIKCITYKIKTYCLKCRKDRENIDPKISSTSNGKSMILSKCAICGSKQSRSKRTNK